MGKTDPDAPHATSSSRDPGAARRAGRQDRCACCRCSATTTPRTATCEVVLKNVRVPVENLLLGEGRGFEIAQGRLGPGRIHHCMRTIGAAEARWRRCASASRRRVAFGKPIAEHSVWEQRIAEARIDIEMCRLLCLKAADMMDKAGNKAARNEIAMIKVAAPRMALQDHRRRHPGARRRRRHGRLRPGRALCRIRTLRLADGPTRSTPAPSPGWELGKYAPAAPTAAGGRVTA